ncbi:MAG: EF-P lysine aminoacylase GenX [Deltaproteobacteria bacterium]|nr:EF-P lysine aminoacylase GenX [Deltaproteobacteria bacterium]
MSPGSRNKSFFAAGERLAAKKPGLRFRAEILQAIRSFFIETGYLEIETPLLIPAPAPELYIDAIHAGNSFLHTSPELCMKRLLASGYEKIFQICKCFRDGERGAAHLPEFTILEWYRAMADYQSLMNECEEMMFHLSQKLALGHRISYGGREIDLLPPWSRLTVNDAFSRYADIPLDAALAAGSFDEAMVTQIEPHLGAPKPAFLCDYPSSLASLARRKRNEPQSAERFELYVGGLELANGFSELIDVVEQKRRFEEEREKRDRLGKKNYPSPDRFLEAMPYMPESAGIALGVDRLVMVLTDQGSIDSVVAFTPEEL